MYGWDSHYIEESNNQHRAIITILYNLSIETGVHTANSLPDSIRNDRYSTGR